MNIKKSFLLIIFLFSSQSYSINKNMFPEDCSSIHNGLFYLSHKGSVWKIIIERSDKIQKAHRVYNKFYYTKKITWVQSCIITGTITEVNDPFLNQSIIGEKETYRITHLTKDYYDYEELSTHDVGKVYRVKNLEELISDQIQNNQ
ncbi:MAG: hypothetical protein SFU98_08795 [Leptospiraceae bacterium]|nr:hypothetical protein [Leptospiraceae bacterium]